MRTLSLIASAAALAAFVMLATTAEAQPTPEDIAKCRSTIRKEFVKYVKAQAKIKQKCNNAVVKAGTGQDAPGGTIPPSCDPNGKIAAALVKLKDKIVGACDDAGVSPALVFPETCLDFENSGCTNSISDGNAIGTCLDCIGSRAVMQAMDLYYLSLADPAGDGDLVKCQVAIGKETTKFLLAKHKILSKCRKAVDKGSIPGPCPDSAAVEAITKAEGKKVGKICKACDTGSLDGITCQDAGFAPSTIGFAVSCPTVVVPGVGGQDCGAIGTIDTLDELVDCVDCVTEFKVDCLDRVAVPHQDTYPIECRGGPTPTPVCTFTTPIPTPSPTPAGCGNNVIQVGEDCDGTQDVACPGACAPPSLGADGCTCPTGTVGLAANLGADLDTGWTGQGHDQDVLMVTNPGSGFIANTYGCSGAGPDTVCSFVVPPTNLTFGPPLPLAAGGVSVCAVNDFVPTNNQGTLDLVTGEFHWDYGLISHVHSGILLAKPCPTCEGDPIIDDDVKGGTCSGGQAPGGMCDVDGVSPLFGSTSRDCLPLTGANIGNLSIVFDDANTGMVSIATSPASPNCRAAGVSSLDCFCDTCSNSAQPCRSDADCPPVAPACGPPVAGTCGGRRCIGGPNGGTPCAASSECPSGSCSVPGAATRPNECDDGVCSDVGGGEGECTGGPVELFCGPQETFRGCATNGDCPFAGDTCSVVRTRNCFNDPVVRTGTPGIPSGAYAGLFCIPPTVAPAVNGAAGLPGLGTLRLPYTLTISVP